MKVNELMIGDWVMLDGIPKCLTLWDIVRISRGVYTAEPIHLTEEMFNANKIHYRLPKNGETFDKEWVIPNGAFHIRQDCYEFWVFEDQVSIRYVHQLQHALRLCGLNDLADNFKVGGEE